MNLRKFGALLLAGALFLAGCGGAANQPAAPQAETKSEAPAEPKSLTLYSSFGADLYTPIVQAFEQKTGIKVDVVFGGTGELLKRLDAEKAAPQADVMLGGGAESYEAYRALFEPYTIKEDRLVPDALKAPDRLWYGFNSLPMVIMYNKNLVKESDLPRGWKELQDPRWQGKLAMSDATKSGTAFVQVVTMLTLYGKEDGKGWEAVRAVVKNAKVLGSSSLPPKGVDAGEYALALTHENAAWKYAKAGGPVGWIYPAEGTATIPDSVAIVKGGKHPNNARLFMDFLFSKETQEMASKQLGLRASRTDVTPPEGLQPAESLKLITLDVGWVSSNREKILSQWKDLLTQ
ncbi:MAG: ABC transporter substrate-binding protein [Bacillota bacterium]